jgi:hypothetical protein
VLVDLKYYVELDVSTSTEKGFYMTDEKQSGEYRNALVLNTQVINDTLFITDPLNPTFQFPQDKLSAHKITDTKAVLILPEHKNLFLNLPEAHLNLQGNYENIILNIHSGKVILQQIAGDLQVISVNANVQAENLEGYFFEASSRNGSVEIKNSNRNTRYLLKVESINGDIHLN